MTKPNKNRITQAVSEYPVPANRSEVENVMAEMGLQCVQEETFYVDSKLTEVETRSSQPVKGVL